METKFKVGDRVRFTQKYKELEWKIAAIGDDYYTLRCVRADDARKIDLLGDLKFSNESDIELVEERKEYKEGEERVTGEDAGFERWQLDRLKAVMKYEDWANNPDTGELRNVSDEEYMAIGMNRLSVGVRRAYDRNWRWSPAYERIRVRVSLDEHRVIDMAFTADEAEQLALVLQQKVREAREDRTMEVNKGR